MEKILLVTLVAAAVGMDPWNSTQELSKTESDHKALSAEKKVETSIKEDVNHADAMLKGNQSILKIQQEQLDDIHSIFEGKSKSEESAEEELAKLQSKLANLSTVLAQAKDQLASDRQVSDATKDALMNDKKACAEATEKKNNAQVALKKAQVALEAVALSSPADVLAAKAEVDKKQEELDSAEAALKAGQDDKAAQEANEEKAEAAVEKSVAARDKALDAVQKTDAEVDTKQKLLAELQNNAANEGDLLSKMQDAVDEQTGEVAQLQAKSSVLHRKLAKKTEQVNGLEKTVNDDTSCVEDLQAKELDYNDHTVVTDHILSACKTADPKLRHKLSGDAWEAKDALDTARYELFNIQKKCAPSDLTIPPVDPAATCDIITGGSCKYLGCHSWRHAHCQLHGPDRYKCVCRPGSCAQDGKCVSRGDSVCDSGATMLDEIKHAADTTYGAEIWLRPAGVVVVAFAVAAAIVLRRQSVKPIDFPENLLG